MSKKQVVGERGPFSARRKKKPVLRLLRGEDLETVSRELRVTAATLSAWRERFLASGEAGLKSRVARCEQEGLPRREVFAAIWRMAHEAAGRPAPELARYLGSPIPRLSEPCCAEPTDQQLQSF